MRNCPKFYINLEISFWGEIYWNLATKFPTNMLILTKIFELPTNQFTYTWNPSWIVSTTTQQLMLVQGGRALPNIKKNLAGFLKKRRKKTPHDTQRVSQVYKTSIKAAADMWVFF